MRLRRSICIIVCMALALFALPTTALVAAADNPSSITEPPASNSAAQDLTGLSTDLADATSSDIGSAADAALENLADEASAADGVSDECDAVSDLTQLVSTDNSDETTTDPPGSDEVSDQFDAEVDDADFAAQALLLSDPGTASCGGTSTPFSGADGPQVNVESSDTNQVTLQVVFPTPTFDPETDGNGDWFTSWDDAGVGANPTIGDPDVPAYAPEIAVPQGATTSVSLLSTTGFALDGAELWPSQPAAVDDVEDVNPPFTENTADYADDADFPAQTVSDGTDTSEGDLTIDNVTTSGGEFDPVTKDATVYTSATFQVKFNGSSGTFGSSQLASPWNQQIANGYQATVANWNTVRQNLRTAPFNFCGEQLLIATAPGLVNQANALAAARNRDGVITRVITVTTTANTAPAIAASQTAITTAVKNDYTQCAIQPNSLLLFGSTDPTTINAAANQNFFVPTFQVPDLFNGNDCTQPGAGQAKDANGCGLFVIATGAAAPAAPPPAAGTVAPQYDNVSGTIATDQPYGFITQNAVSEIGIGRMPATTAAMAAGMVAKTIAYEDSPPNPNNTLNNQNPYTSALITDYFQTTNPCPAAIVPAGCTKEERTYVANAVNAYNTLKANGYTNVLAQGTRAASANPKTDFQNRPLPAAFTFNNTNLQTNMALNAGQGLWYYRDHGSQNEVDSTDFTSANALALVNSAGLTYDANGNPTGGTDKNLSGIAFLLACLSGGFTGASSLAYNGLRYAAAPPSAGPYVAESLLQNTQGGAVGDIGASVLAPSNPTSYLGSALMFLLYPPLLNRPLVNQMGSLLNVAKFGAAVINGFAPYGTTAPATVMNALFMMYNYFGDPTLQMWTKQPLKAQTLLATIGSSNQVSVTATGADAGAVVTLEDDGQPVGISTLASDGTATITPQTAIADPNGLTVSLSDTDYVSSIVAVGNNPGNGTPEAPVAIALPLLALVLIGGAVYFRRRRRGLIGRPFDLEVG